MPDTGDAKDTSFSVFHSAAEEANTKRENDAIKRQEQSWDNEGGHMSSTAGRVMRVSSVDLPYVVVRAPRQRRHRTWFRDHARGRSLH